MLLRGVNLPSILVWGFAATVLLTTSIVTAQSLGLTRIDVPFILGSMFTPDRDRAKVLGLVLHLLNGWVFAIVFALFFETIDVATWWFGSLLGVMQGVFVVVVALPMLPGLHPRMVSDFRGPEPARLLEPPGFLASNYGRKTAIVLILAHALFGAVLGATYSPI